MSLRGLWMDWYRKRMAALPGRERRLVVGAPSQPGDFVECHTCGERWEFDPERPEQTSFERRWDEFLHHARLMHPDT